MEDLISLLEEAAALKHVIKKEILQTLVGEKGAKNEDVFISLLADLHQEQLDDGIRWFDDIMQVRRRHLCHLIASFVNMVS